jgi:hypothetical protein
MYDVVKGKALTTYKKITDFDVMEDLKKILGIPLSTPLGTGNM